MVQTLCQRSFYVSVHCIESKRAEVSEVIWFFTEMFLNISFLQKICVFIADDQPCQMCRHFEASSDIQRPAQRIMAEVLEPATSRFGAQHLNHCATAVPGQCVFQSKCTFPHFLEQAWLWQCHENFSNPNLRYFVKNRPWRHREWIEVQLYSFFNLGAN